MTVYMAAVIAAGGGGGVEGGWTSRQGEASGRLSGMYVRWSVGVIFYQL